MNTNVKTFIAAAIAVASCSPSAYASPVYYTIKDRTVDLMEKRNPGGDYDHTNKKVCTLKRGTRVSNTYYPKGNAWIEIETVPGSRAKCKGWVKVESLKEE